LTKSKKDYSSNRRYNKTLHSGICVVSENNTFSKAETIISGLLRRKRAGIFIVDEI
jgi:hypothetical protein